MPPIIYNKGKWEEKQLKRELFIHQLVTDDKY